MRQKDRPRRWKPSFIHGAAVVAGLCAGSAAAQAPDGPREPQPPRLSLTFTDPIASARPGQPGQDIGLQWRQALGSGRTIDITAWRRVPPQQPDAISLVQDREPLYGARVEMRIAPRRGFVTDLRAIGLQLDNGGKIMLRRKDGNPTLYYRQTF